MIPLPELLEDAWARSLPGRECASQKEVRASPVRFRTNWTLSRHRRMTESGPKAVIGRWDIFAVQQSPAASIFQFFAIRANGRAIDAHRPIRDWRGR
jgi:hypothetical protein